MELHMDVAKRLAAVSIAFFVMTAPTRAEEIVVTVSGFESGQGEVGCSLYAGADGFPMEPAKAMSIWRPARHSSVQCRFEGLAPGAYAVAVSHDLNGNRETDTNFFGIPTEAWGVSNNVRPTLRAPRFDEAEIRLEPGAKLAIAVEVAE